MACIRLPLVFILGNLETLRDRYLAPHLAWSILAQSFSSLSFGWLVENLPISLVCSRLRQYVYVRPRSQCWRPCVQDTYKCLGALYSSQPQLRISILLESNYYSLAERPFFHHHCWSYKRFYALINWFSCFFLFLFLLALRHQCILGGLYQLSWCL